jgi:NADPH-dependent curcumin reductase CurA
MQNMTNRQVRLKSRPSGVPQSEHFEIVSEPVPEPGDGQVLVRNRFLSAEPAMRGWVSAVANYSTPVGIGEVMRAFAVGEVVTSRHPDYREGDRVMGMFDWQEYAVAGEAQIAHKLPADDGMPISAHLGVLGTGCRRQVAAPCP